MSNVMKGIVLAILNIFVIGQGLEWVVRGAYGATLFFGFVPAIASGAAMGALAGRLRWERLVTLQVIGFVAVAAIGAVVIGPHVRTVDYAAIVGGAWVPTSFGAIVLERWTRPAPILARAVVVTLPLRPASTSPA